MELHNLPDSHIILDTALNLSRVATHLINKDLEKARSFATEVVLYLEHSVNRGFTGIVAEIFEHLIKLIDHFKFLNELHFNSTHFIEQIMDYGLMLERSALLV